AVAAAEGDAAAVRHLEEQFFAGVGATVRRVDGSPAFVDEVRQELRVRLLLPRSGEPPRIADYSGRGSLMSWIHVVAARIAVTLKRADRYGAASSTLSSSAMASDESPEIAHLRGLFREELQAAFNEALTELTPRQRSLLKMHFLDGVP